MDASSARVVPASQSVMIGSVMAELVVNDIRLRANERDVLKGVTSHRPPQDGRRAGRANR